MEPITITAENFEQEVLQSDVPVLVDIWASWCGPCKMLSPIVDEIAKESEGFKVGKINADDEGALAAKFGVSSIPTLLVFKGGEVVNQSVGFIPKEKVLALLPQ
ncbi:MAG: thioredoxin [Lachnospiraceae bacterium]|nr:thioredoxin [Lachnospiraceae bacterium]